MKKLQLTAGYHSIVDDDIYDELKNSKWCTGLCQRTGVPRNAHRRRGRKLELLHAYVFKRKFPGLDFEMIDHINMNPLDNRIENLRPCTRSENAMNIKKHKDNSSGFKGVRWESRRKHWIANICKDYKSIYLGSYKSPIEAAYAYDKKAKELFGQFANLNFSEGK